MSRRHAMYDAAGRAKRAEIAASQATIAAASGDSAFTFVNYAFDDKKSADSFASKVPSAYKSAGVDVSIHKKLTPGPTSAKSVKLDKYVVTIRAEGPLVAKATGSDMKARDKFLGIGRKLAESLGGKMWTWGSA